MRFGSGSVRSRCIMQFSLAAGSESAAGEGESACELRPSVSHQAQQTFFSPMPSMKAGYRRSVSRGSGSSLKYSFSVPAMAFMSMSLSITRMSLVSAGEQRD